MGPSGNDEKWRWVVVWLHQQWMQRGDVEAQDVKMPDGGNLPSEVRPRSSMRAMKGSEAVERLKAIAADRSYRAARVVRLHCAEACRKGKRCHGESFGPLLRRLFRGGNAEADNGGDRAEAGCSSDPIEEEDEECVEIEHDDEAGDEAAAENEQRKRKRNKRGSRPCRRVRRATAAQKKQS